MTHKDFITNVAEQLEWPEEKNIRFHGDVHRSSERRIENE